MDNAGENLDLQRELEKSEWNVKFEFTAPNTPQQNGKVERKFPTLKGRVRAMLNWAGVTENMRVKLWSYAVYNTTQHDVILTTRNRTRNPYKLFGENNQIIMEI